MLAALALSTGCAAPRCAHARARCRRPDAPPELDFLVGQAARDGPALPEARDAPTSARCAKDPQAVLLLQRTWPSCSARDERARPTRWCTPSARFELEPDDDEPAPLPRHAVSHPARARQRAERVLQRRRGRRRSTPTPRCCSIGSGSSGDRLDEALGGGASGWSQRSPRRRAGYIALAERLRAHGRRRPTPRRRCARRSRRTRASSRSTARSRAAAASAAIATARSGSTARCSRQHPTTTRRCSRWPTRRSTLGRTRGRDRDARARSRSAIPTICARRCGSATSIYEAGASPTRSARFAARARAAIPSSTRSRYFLGIARRRMDNDDGAIARVRAHPARARALRGRARCSSPAIHERHGAIYAARARGGRGARKREPDAASSTSTPRACARRPATSTGAVAFLEGLLAASPDDDEVLYNLGVIYGEANRDGRGDPLHGAARSRKNPEHAGALNYVGYTLAERGENLDEAER